VSFFSFSPPLLFSKSKVFKEAPVLTVWLSRHRDGLLAQTHNLVCMHIARTNVYAAPQHVGFRVRPSDRGLAAFRDTGLMDMQDSGYGLPRIPLPETVWKVPIGVELECRE
jgi:hypothetical protein